MAKTDSCLIFSENSYDIFGNQSIHTFNVTDSIDKNFQFQFRYSHEESKKIDFSILKIYLEKNTKILYKKRTLHYPDYKPAKMDKTRLATELFKLFPENQHAEFIYNKIFFRKDGEKIEEIKDKNFINFYKIVSFSKNTIQFGYEIPQTNTTDITPNCCIYSIGQKTPTNKIYLFPYSSRSIQNLANEKAMKEFPANTREFKILYFDEDTHSDRDMYLTLQQNISEILEHLEKPKFFGKNSTDKIEIFLELAGMISSKKSLDNIKDFLNRYDKVEILSKHRDPWGIFAFFKGKTHSALAWNELRKLLPNNSCQPAEPSFSRQAR